MKEFDDDPELDLFLGELTNSLLHKKEISNNILKSITPKSLEAYVFSFKDSNEKVTRKTAIGVYFIDRYRTRTSLYTYRVSFIAKDDKIVYPITDSKEHFLAYSKKLRQIEEKIDNRLHTPINPKVDDLDLEGYGIFSSMYRAANLGEIEDVIPEHSDPGFELPQRRLLDI